MAARDLKRVDAAAARRIIRRLEWLAEDYEDVGGERLTGELAGLHKFRVGPYRVIFQLLHDERVLVVHAVGHRSDIYRR